MNLDEREFWLKVRRGLLTINDAIESRLQVGKYEPEERSMARQARLNGGSPPTPIVGDKRRTVTRDS
jgi:hypothetical protein